MTREGAVRSIAGMIAAFAAAFFVTALLQQNSPSSPTARIVPLRAREESLAREVADLRQMSRSYKPIEPAAARSIPVPKAWNGSTTYGSRRWS